MFNQNNKTMNYKIEIYKSAIEGSTTQYTASMTRVRPDVTTKRAYSEVIELAVRNITNAQEYYHWVALMKIAYDWVYKHGRTGDVIRFLDEVNMATDTTNEFEIKVIQKA